MLHYLNIRLYCSRTHPGLLVVFETDLQLDGVSVYPDALALQAARLLDE